MNFWAAGKFLLFGEYLVLKGANCLAIPSSFGQSLSVEKNNENSFQWKSYANGKQWLAIQFSSDLEITETTDKEKAIVVQKLLKFIQVKEPEILSQPLVFQTDTNFPLQWGLGTSSTLISLLNQWSGVDAYTMLENSFGGSGYDIACATAKTPIIYQIEKHHVTPSLIHRPVISQLLFIYSGQKQKSNVEVKRFNDLDWDESHLSKMNEIVQNAIQANKIEDFEDCMNQSELMLSKILERKPVKEEYFEDYPYAIKSLGAWGGDFWMATFRDEEEARFYFMNKGYSVQLNYWEFIRQ